MRRLSRCPRWSWRWASSTRRFCFTLRSAARCRCCCPTSRSNRRSWPLSCNCELGRITAICRCCARAPSWSASPHRYGSAPGSHRQVLRSVWRGRRRWEPRRCCPRRGRSCSRQIRSGMPDSARPCASTGRCSGWAWTRSARFCASCRRSGRAISACGILHGH